jgi:hypothetical protein
MDLKKHEPSFWALVIILAWLLMVVSIIIYK